MKDGDEVTTTQVLRAALTDALGAHTMWVEIAQKRRESLAKAEARVAELQAEIGKLANQVRVQRFKGEE